MDVLKINDDDDDDDDDESRSCRSKRELGVISVQMIFEGIF